MARILRGAARTGTPRTTTRVTVRRAGRGRGGFRRTPVTQNQRLAEQDRRFEEAQANIDRRTGEQRAFQREQAQQGIAQAGIQRQFQAREAGRARAGAFLAAREEPTSPEQIAEINRAFGVGAQVGAPDLTTRAGRKAEFARHRAAGDIQVRGRFVPAQQAQEVFRQASQRSDLINRQLAREGHTGAPQLPLSNFGEAAVRLGQSRGITSIPADARFDTGEQREFRQQVTRLLQQRSQANLEGGLQRELDDILDTAQQMADTQPDQPPAAAPAAAPAAPAAERPAQQLPVTAADQARDAEIERLRGELQRLGPATGAGELGPSTTVSPHIREIGMIRGAGDILRQQLGRDPTGAELEAELARLGRPAGAGELAPLPTAPVTNGTTLRTGGPPTAGDQNLARVAGIVGQGPLVAPPPPQVGSAAAAAPEAQPLLGAVGASRTGGTGQVAQSRFTREQDRLLTARELGRRGEDIAGRQAQIEAVRGREIQDVDFETAGFGAPGRQPQPRTPPIPPMKFPAARETRAGAAGLPGRGLSREEKRRTKAETTANLTTKVREIISTAASNLQGGIGSPQEVVRRIDQLLGPNATAAERKEMASILLTNQNVITEAAGKNVAGGGSYVNALRAAAANLSKGQPATAGAPVGAAAAGAPSRAAGQRSATTTATAPLPIPQAETAITTAAKGLRASWQKLVRKQRKSVGLGGATAGPRERRGFANASESDIMQTIFTESSDWWSSMADFAIAERARKTDRPEAIRRGTKLAVDSLANELGRDVSEDLQERIGNHVARVFQSEWKR